MSSAPTSVDRIGDPRNPFGLPLGSVRAMMSLAIGAFFWLALLYPGPPDAFRPPLGHFFLLALVLMAFSPSTRHAAESESHVLPWVLRLLFVGGSVAVVAFVATQFPERLTVRLKPEPEEFQRWWVPLLACTAGGFTVGLLLRGLLGRERQVFRTLRSWLSVVGVVMLTLEIGFVLINATTQAPADFLQWWDAVELCVVAAYFGTRA
jgi:hypothetical protein